MSDQNEFKKEQDGYNSRREERRERHAERRGDRQAGGLGWLAGLVLIAVGVFYLLQTAGILPSLTSLANWWALFLLLPAVGTLSAALGAYRHNGGHWSPEVTGPFLAGLLFLGITAVFLFDLNFGWFVPLFLIAAGLFLLFSPRLTKNP